MGSQASRRGRIRRVGLRRRAAVRGVGWATSRATSRKGHVIVEGITAYINAGANAHVRVGDVFTVYSSGEDLIDPSTGLKLRRHEKMIGSIQITKVLEQFVVGTIRSDGSTMKRGDRVGVR